MKRKILTEAQEEILHDMYDSKFWDVFKVYLVKENQNLLNVIAGSGFNDEFHFNKGKLERSRIITRFMEDNYKMVERRQNEETK